ncbi:MAG: PEP-CTERM sorting domain-containing protein [Phycisphaerales bacterium]
MRTLAIAALAAVAGSANAQVINEFVNNHTGTDTNEFIEFLGAPNTDYSNLWIIEIEGDFGAQGLIDDASFNIGTTDANGIWWSGFNDNLAENGTATYLLVEGYFGSTGVDIDLNDDGIIDNPQWTSILDAVAVEDGGADDLTYGLTLFQGFDGVNSFTTGGASRIPNGFDSDSITDWTRNDFNLAGILPGTPEAGTALNTPGAPNVVPAPATAALLGLGGLAAARRRR